MIRLKSGNIPDRFFNKEQLRRGARVEHEHTNSALIAKEIAKAHLRENPNYYIYLSKMERTMNKKQRGVRR